MMYIYEKMSEIVKDQYNVDMNKIPNSKRIQMLKNKDDETKIVSVYKGQAVPSIIFDSLGTRKFAALASYVIEE